MTNDILVVSYHLIYAAVNLQPASFVALSQATGSSSVGLPFLLPYYAQEICKGPRQLLGSAKVHLAGLEEQVVSSALFLMPAAESNSKPRALSKR